MQMKSCYLITVYERKGSGCIQGWGARCTWGVFFFLLLAKNEKNKVLDNFSS